MNESDVVIRVEGLGKKYALHHEKSERYTALRQAAKSCEEEFWALKDVSFEIRARTSRLPTWLNWHPSEPQPPATYVQSNLTFCERQPVNHSVSL